MIPSRWQIVMDDPLRAGAGANTAWYGAQRLKPLLKDTELLEPTRGEARVGKHLTELMHCTIVCIRWELAATTPSPRRSLRHQAPPAAAVDRTLLCDAPPSSVPSAPGRSDEHHAVLARLLPS
jgi:hypothetical protein